MEFRELTKRDAEISLEHYLEKLKGTFTLPPEVAERQVPERKPEVDVSITCPL
jgi:hypothetical protein